MRYQVVILIFGSVLTFSAAWAAPYGTGPSTKPATCVGFLIPARADHVFTSMSGEKTAQARKRLDEFRRSIVQKSFDPSPSEVPTTATSQSSPREIEAVYKRLLTIDREQLNAKPSPGGESEGQNKLTLGSIYSDDQIRQLVEDRKAAVTRFEDVYNMPHNFGARMLRRFGYALNLLLWNGVEIFAGLHSADAPILYVSIFGALPLAWLSLSIVPESVVRDLSNYDLYQRERLEAYANTIDLEKPGQWAFHSFDVYMNQSLVDFIMKTGDVHQTFAHQAWESATFPRKGDALNEKIIAGPSPRDEGGIKKMTWVRVDELLEITEDGPVLTSMLRLTDSRPKYPQPSKLSQWISNIQASLGQLNPVHAGVGK